MHAHANEHSQQSDSQAEAEGVGKRRTCSTKKSLHLVLPPASMSFICCGCHESIVLLLTKLRCTPRPLRTRASAGERFQVYRQLHRMHKYSTRPLNLAANSHKDVLHACEDRSSSDRGRPRKTAYTTGGREQLQQAQKNSSRIGGWSVACRLLLLVCRGGGD